MLQTTHVYLFNSKNQILLGQKKKGFGVGKWNGFGGKNKEGETMIQTALRELHEEAGVLLHENQVKKAGMLHFFYAANPNRDQDTHVFTGIYDGDFEETEEMLPQRRDLDKIPYAHMREDDLVRLPKLIAGENFDMTFHFDNEGKLIS